MDFKIGFSWHILYRADSPLFNCLNETPLLRLVEPEQYFNRISARNPTLYHPIDIEFTNLFHLQLRRSLERQLKNAIREKNFPYKLFISSLQANCRIGVAMQLFMPDMLSIRLVCHNELPLARDSVFALRQLHNHRDLLFLCDEAVRITSKALCDGKTFVRQHNHPVLKVNISSSDDKLLDANRKFFAALLVNDENYEESDQKIFEKVLAANAAHNRKNKKSKLILINKQAYLTVTNRNSEKIPIVIQEVRKRERMFELGYVLQSFYETYPSIRQRYAREMDYLFFATQRYIKDPKLTFSASYGNTLAWSVVLKSLRLKDAFKSATRFDVDAESKLSNLFDKIPHPRYARPAFWNDVRNILGENYMAKSTGGNNVSIGTMHGSFTMGDQSPASTVHIGGSDKAEILRVIEQLAQLRQEFSEGAKREEFDELVVKIRSEIKSEKPDASNLSKLFGTLKSLAEGVVSHGIAIGLIHQASKMLGLGI